MRQKSVKGRKIARVVQDPTRVDGGRRVQELHGLVLDDGSIIAFHVHETEEGDRYVVSAEHIPPQGVTT